MTRDDVRSAETAIRPHIRRTPLVTVAASEIVDGDARRRDDDAEVLIKLELLQHSGSFKARGAFTSLLLRDVPPGGVVAASGGNHGAAVAYAAGRLGMPAKIFVPRISSPAKVARIRSYGADLEVTGAAYADALAASEAWAADHDAMMVHAFDQPHTISGQATLALEMQEQDPAIDTVLVAVGGGGLLAGVATWYRNDVRVIGIEPESAPTLTRALEAGEPIDAEAGGIAADSLAPRRIGSLVFPIAQQYVADVLLVTDDAIRSAQEMLWRVLRIVAEPGGAAAVAAIMSGVYVPRPGERIGVVVSGGNTVAVDFTRP